jgi:hypothetical protein
VSAIDILPHLSLSNHPVLSLLPPKPLSFTNPAFFSLHTGASRYPDSFLPLSLSSLHPGFFIFHHPGESRSPEYPLDTPFLSRNNLLPSPSRLVSSFLIRHTCHKSAVYFPVLKSPKNVTFSSCKHRTSVLCLTLPESVACAQTYNYNLETCIHK